MTLPHRHRRHYPPPQPLQRRQDTAISAEFPTDNVDVFPTASVISVTDVNTNTLLFDTRVTPGRTETTVLVNNPVPTQQTTSDESATPSATNEPAAAPAQSVPIQTLVGVCVGVVAILALLIGMSIWWSKKQRERARGGKINSYYESDPSTSRQRDPPRRSFSAPAGDSSFLSLELAKGERVNATGRDWEISKKRSKENFHQDNELSELDHSRVHAQRDVVDEITNPFRTPPRARSLSLAHTDSTYSQAVSKKSSEKDLRVQARTDRQRDMMALDALISALDNSAAAASSKNPGQRYEAPRPGNNKRHSSLSVDSDFPLPPPEVFRAALGRHSRDEGY